MKYVNGSMFRKRAVTLVMAVAVVLSIPLASVASAAAVTPANPWLNRRVLNIAHQGGEYEAPSDTMYALKTAVQKGADVLEIDVHATSDGKLVAMHDNTVDRTTNGTGRIDQMTLDQINALDAAYNFAPDCGTCPGRPATDYIYRGIATGDKPMPPELKGTYKRGDFRVPTLREILKEFPDKMINIEIKATAPDTTPYEAEIARLLNKFNRDDDTIVVSFSDAAMTQFKLHPTTVSAAPGLGTMTSFWLSTQGSLPGITLPGYQAVQVPTVYQGLPIVTPPFVTKAHNNNLAVHVWTIDDRAQMEALIDMGVDGIMTSRPTLLEQVLIEKGVQYTDTP